MRVTMIVFGLALCGSASAGVGVGYDAMLGGVSGLSVQVPLTDKMTVQAIANASYASEWSYEGGARLSYVLAAQGPASLGLAAGIGTVGVASTVSAPFVEMPLWIDYKFAEHFSVTGQTGLVYQTGDRNDLVVFNQGDGNFLGSFAFHYWF